MQDWEKGKSTSATRGAYETHRTAEANATAVVESRKPPSICTSPCVCRGRRCQIHTPDIAPNLVSEGGYVGSTVVCNHGEAGGQRVMPRQRLYLKGSSPVRGVRTTGYTGTADSCSHVSASNQAKLSSLASPSQTPLAGSTLDLRWAICRLPFPRSHPARQSAMREENPEVFHRVKDQTATPVHRSVDCSMSAPQPLVDPS